MTRYNERVEAKAVNFKEVKAVDDRKVFYFVTALEVLFVASFFLIYNF